MATAGAAINRRDAVRYLSDESLTTRIAEAAFSVEALTDAGPFGVPAGSAPSTMTIALSLEQLAGETAAQRPAVARTLRTAAADLRCAANASSPALAYVALTDALALLEQM